jgi:STE24 endopeptidase
VLAFVGIFVLNAFVPSATSQARAAKYFSPEVIDRGLQFAREARLISWASFSLQLALLTALVCTPWSRRLTDWFDRLTGHRWLLTLVLVSAAYLVISRLLSLPFGFIALEQARAWHMTERTVASWLLDWLKGIAVGGAEGAVILLGLYGSMHLFKRWWWLAAAVGGTVLGMVYAFVMPEVIQPLFNTFEPLHDSYLRERVKALAQEAGVEVADVQVMDASTRGRHLNAYFIGFGSTRRIVLYDTLLKTNSGIDAASTASALGALAGQGMGPLIAVSEAMAARQEGYDETETILAHELGHWRHNHIVIGIALAGLGGLVGLFLLSRILNWAVNRRPFLLTGPTDPAGLPLVLLLLTIATWLTAPVQNYISRQFERQADESSLELSRNPEAFIASEKRMALGNLSNVAPTPFNVWMFSTHPPTVERIEMAEQWEKRITTQSPPGGPPDQ